MSRSETDILIQRVANRQRVSSLADRFYVFTLILAAAYALTLLVSRLLAVIPDVFEPLTLLVPPLAALVLATVFHVRPGRTETARLIDTRMNTNDLFLTSTLLDRSPEEYRAIVEKQARERSGKVDPHAVVRYDLLTKGKNVILCLCALFLGLTFLPQLDPFGKEAARLRATERHTQLADSRKATALRTEMLKKKDLEAPQSAMVKQSLDDLAKTFKQAKPQNKQADLKKLAEHQKDLGELWKKISEDKLKDAFSQKSAQQSFGGSANKKQSEWKRRLQKGDAGGVRKELDELKKLAKKIAEMKNSAEKKKLQELLSRRLKSLQEFMQSEMNSTQASTSLQRALEQLSMADTKGLSSEALKGLQESLNLTDMEMQQLAQAMRDLQALEQGLSAAQMAKMLGKMGKLPGEGCEGCKTMADYESLYNQMMAGAGKGKGPGEGMKGPGTGEGGKAAYDDEQKTDFKPEKSQSALTAGKLLLQWKSKGLSEAGRAREEYARTMSQVKQGMTEAILHEQVPPGYHDTIKKYFDKIEEAENATEPEE